MIAATSVLQQQASDIRTTKINWQSYNQSQMISNEDYHCISALDSEKKAQYLKDNQYQSAKTYLNLLSHVSKDTTIQYLLVMIDDLLTVSCCCHHMILILLIEISNISGRPLPRWNLFRLCIKTQGKCMGSFLVIAESFWWIYHQHGITHPGKIGLLGNRSDAQIWSSFLLAVAKGSAHRSSEYINSNFVIVLFQALLYIIASDVTVHASTKKKKIINQKCISSYKCCAT